jgi:hypothetical protein
MKRLKIQLLAFALMLFAATGAFASTSYNVTVDTSSLNELSGYLYMQYISVNGVDSTATVSAFSTDGALASGASSSVVDGSAVSGSLTASPYTVTFANTNGVNDYNHGITFGSTISLILTLSDAISGGIDGGASTFSLSLFADEDGTTPLLNTSSDYAGLLLTINLVNDGSSSYGVLVSQANVSPVPVPAAIWLFGSGLLGLAGIKRGKRA